MEKCLPSAEVSECKLPFAGWSWGQAWGHWGSLCRRAQLEKGIWRLNLLTNQAAQPITEGHGIARLSHFLCRWRPRESFSSCGCCYCFCLGTFEARVWFPCSALKRTLLCFEIRCHSFPLCSCFWDQFSNYKSRLLGPARVIRTWFINSSSPSHDSVSCFEISVL